MYDKKMWDDDGALIQPPTFRAVADIVLDIVGNATGHKWIGYIDDALFATLDLTGGYKSPEEVGLELGKKALTSAVSYGASSIGNAASTAASAAITNTAANVAAQAGISMAQSYATSVATNAINSVNIKYGKLDFDGEGFGKSLYSKDTIAGALSSGVNVAVTSGAQNFLFKDENGIELTDKVFNTDALSTIAGLTGNAAAAITEYAISGHTTVNLINTSMFGLKNKDLKTGTLSTMHKGLFAVTFDSEEGVSSTISSAGFDMNLGNIATAMNGLHDITKITSAKVSSAFGGKEQISTLNAVNMLGYTNSNLNVSLANDIWQDRLGVEYGDTGDDYGNYTIGDSKIRLSDQLLGGGKEGSAKLAAVMSHEGTHAYGNRIEGYAHLAAADTYSQINQIFGLKADSSFENQIVSALYNPNSWTENTGDVDHWTLMDNASLAYDGSGNLYDKKGYLILKTDKGIQEGLAEILGISSEEARQMIENSGFDSVPGSWNVDTNFGKSITFDSTTKTGITYGDLYDSKDHKITDYYTGQSGTLKDLNPKTIYEKMITNGTMDLRPEAMSVPDAVYFAMGSSRYISYEQFKAQNYITGAGPTYNTNNTFVDYDVTGMVGAIGSKSSNPHRGADGSVPKGTPVYNLLWNDSSIIENVYNQEIDLLTPQGKHVDVNTTLTYIFKGQEYNDNILTRYLHLSEVNVKRNQTVSSETILGKTGNSGYWNGGYDPHSHEDISTSKRSPYLDYITNNTKNVSKPIYYDNRFYYDKFIFANMNKYTIRSDAWSYN